MARRYRAASALVAAAVCAAVAGGVYGAEPTATPDTIGGSVQSRVYLADSRSLAVLNRSTIPARFTVEPSGGLTAEPASLTLEPGEEGRFTLAGEVAPDAPVRLTVRLEQLAEHVGAETTALAFGVTVSDVRPPDPSDLLPLILAGLLALAVVLTAARRTLRRSPA
jgi:hypothetical protein